MFRIGQGYDVHRLEKGRELWLGGVLIPHSSGLSGHSDADVLLHAICDAVLGAAGSGDIGHHFPDSDPGHRGRSSREFLKIVGAIAKAGGWSVSNIDATASTGVGYTTVTEAGETTTTVTSVSSTPTSSAY